jgi:hypothetical protein
MKKKNQNKKSSPVVIKGMTFDEMIKDVQSRPAPEPLTKEKQEELDKLLQQLIESQGPGDALFMFGVPTKKTKS